MRALLLGGRGAVGSHISRLLQRNGHEVIPSGRTAPSGGVAVQLTRNGLDGLDAALRERRPELVINATGVENPALGAALGTIPLLDISASSRYVRELSIQSERAGGTMVSASGLAPGLSTALAAAVHPTAGDTVSVALMLGSGEAHGPAAVEWTAGLLGQPIDAIDAPRYERVRNFSRPASFTLDGKRARHLRTDFPDQFLLRGSGASVHNYLAMTSASSTAALQLLTLMPRIGRRILSMVPAVGSDRWQLIARNERTGQQIGAHGREQSLATAAVTAALADALLESGRSGIVPVESLLTVERLNGIAEITVLAADTPLATHG